MCGSCLFEISDRCCDAPERKVNQAVATQDNVAVREPVSSNVQQRKRSLLILVELTVSADQIGYDVNTYVFNRVQFDVSYPVEITTGRVEQCFCIKFLEQ